jgi:hypothetical protein
MQHFSAFGALHPGSAKRRRFNVRRLQWVCYAKGQEVAAFA